MQRSGPQTMNFVLQILLLAALGGYAVVKSEYSAPMSISPGDGLQSYLCNGLLQSNTTLVLGPGEHRISSGPLGCFVYNVSNVMILGSNSGESIIRCQGDRLRIAFVFLQNLTIEKVNFVGCNGSGLSTIVFFQFAHYVSLRHCTFLSNSPGYSVAAESSGYIDITNCMFQQRTEISSFDGNGAIRLNGSTNDTTISGSTFQGNTINYGELLLISGSKGKMYISNCIFRYNSVASYLIRINKTREIIDITNCAFENNNRTTLVSIDSDGSIINITDGTFRYNYATTLLDLTGSSEIIYIANCKFDSNVESSLWIQPKGPVKIADSTFRYNYAVWFKVTSEKSNGVQVNDPTTALSITKCTFLGNSFRYFLLVLQSRIGNTYMNGCIFEGNSIQDSMVLYYGLVAIVANFLNLSGSLYIADSRFESNTGHKNTVTIQQTPDSISISNSTFTDVAFYVFTNFNDTETRSLKTSINITDCTFQNGTLGTQPLVLLLWNPLSTVYISRCTFQKNNFGALRIYEFLPISLNVTITDCTFLNNKGLFGGAILINSKGTFLIVNSTFVNNSATVGAAMMITNDPGRDAVATNDLCEITLLDVVIQNNYCNGQNFDETRGGAIWFSGALANIGGTAYKGSQFISNGPQGAIQGADGYLTFWGKVTFANNSGENGGAINLLNVQLSFLADCVVSFVSNIASRFGGAIYNEGRKRNSFYINAGILQSRKYCAVFKNNGSVSFQDNHAQLAGDAIYATPIYDCYFYDRKKSILDTYLNETNVILDMYPNAFKVKMSSNKSQIVSTPIKVHICQSNDQDPSTNSAQYNLDMYPGGTLQLNVTTEDSAHILSPSAVYAQIEVIGTQQIRLGAQQDVQWVGKECTTLSYQIFGPERTTFNLLLSSYPGYAPTVLKVHLQPCVAGLELHVSSDRCICSNFLTDAGLLCDTALGTVIRGGTRWIGVYIHENKSIPVTAYVCPLNYCKNMTQISLANPKDLCSGERTGILCGHCSDGYSVVFGSSVCRICSNVWLITILMYAVLGALLVAVLFALNLTVAQGTLYGLLFYANIIQVNATIFFNQSVLSPLQVLISLLNLDLGFPLCFYDGMDDAAKAGLQFVFPTYLLSLTITVIVICHYCLRRNTMNRNCFDRLNYLIGQRAVGVLCTLIYLSYSKLLRTVIDIFTFSTIKYQDGNMRVWFYDGNINYLHKEHAGLFMVAMGVFILFLIPYTLALTFIPVIEHYSEHNRLFNYLHKMANRVKPMNDVYFAPFRGKWRFWLGARLWLLIFLYIISPFYSSDQPKLLLFIHAITVILFILIQAQIHPFGNSIQETHNCSTMECIFDKFYNWLDLTYSLNYATLSLSVLYILSENLDANQTGQGDMAVGILVCLYGVLVMATVLYHVVVMILMVCNVHKRIKKKIRNLFFQTQLQFQPIEMDYQTDDDKTTSCDLREPLSEWI